METIDTGFTSVWEAYWEFDYSAAKVMRNVALSLRRKFVLLMLWFLRFLGCRIVSHPMQYNEMARYVDVDSDDMRRVLYGKISEYQRYDIIHKDLMIIVGFGEYYQLLDATHDHDFMTAIEIRVEEQGKMYILGIPVAVVADFVGIAVIPDFAKLRTVKPLPMPETRRMGTLPPGTEKILADYVARSKAALDRELKTL